MERSRVVERSLVAERSRSRVAEQSRSQADQHDTPYVIEDNIHVFMAFFFSLATNASNGHEFYHPHMANQ
jgi:hypothetical protein